MFELNNGVKLTPAQIVAGGVETIGAALTVTT